MQKSQPQAAAAAFGMQDVLFVVFKHKWMIALLSLLGFGAAAAVNFSKTPIYQSEAKLLVRYVLERRSVDTFQNSTHPNIIAGDSVINTEIEILTSTDMALEVAEKIGAEVLIPDSVEKATLSDAACSIIDAMEVGLGQSGNVLRVVYGSPDPELSKKVLREIVERYFEKHLEIHRSAAAFDLVAKQAEEVGERLKETERQLNKLRTDSGILSLADATSALLSQQAKTQEDLMNAKAVFAERKAGIESLGKAFTDGDELPKSGESSKNTGDPPPAQVITEYRTVMEMLAFLQKREMDLRLKFKPGNPLLSNNQRQITTYDGRRRDLVLQYPDLAAESEVLEKNVNNPAWNLILEKARLASVSAKIAMLKIHLQEISEQFGQQYAIGAQIEEIDRRRQMEDAEYRSLEANLKNAKIDQTLDPSRMPNITVVQQPTEPIETYDKKIQKIILGLAGGGMALGLGLAFMIELLFNPRIKRPIEIQTRLQLPLLLSIPYIRAKSRGGLMLSHASVKPRIAERESPELPATVHQDSFGSGARKANHFILPYSEAIRDRVIFNFEINNVTHKPKLVAVTGLSEGAGASTIAAGLAKSFSEIKGAKVLLVDLSSYHAEDSPLLGEVPQHSLNGALHVASHSKFKESPQKLYYASAMARRDDSGLTTFTPHHLYELMPELQASEFDYIIFDMPTIDQTSRTLTMAGLMDKVILVLDAENTSRDVLKWGYSELVRGGADVSCVFNKTRAHVPGWLIGGT
jgi:uncharacterized protein involved in exopolysaccharide biosynthesis/Mrp family chromosome partitioning ATPase